jgi:hypothetical protein
MTAASSVAHTQLPELLYAETAIALTWWCDCCDRVFCCQVASQQQQGFHQGRVASPGALRQGGHLAGRQRPWGACRAACLQVHQAQGLTLEVRQQQQRQQQLGASSWVPAFKEGERRAVSSAYSCGAACRCCCLHI